MLRAFGVPSSEASLPSVKTAVSDRFSQRQNSFHFPLVNSLPTRLNPRPSAKGPLAQLVEQRIENPCVPGSNPGRAATPFCEFLKNIVVLLLRHLTRLSLHFFAELRPLIALRKAFRLRIPRNH